MPISHSTVYLREIVQLKQRVDVDSHHIENRPYLSLMSYMELNAENLTPNTQNAAYKAET